VVLNDCKSSWSKVLSGIPQGSVLGPLLYVIYVNDLPVHVNNPIQLFADDTKVYARVVNIDDCYQLQSDLKELESWSQKWQISFNISKCKSMHIGRANPQFVYTLNNKPVQQVHEERDFGILFDDQLKFHANTAQVVSKANRILALINRCFSSLNIDQWLCCIKH